MSIAAKHAYRFWFLKSEEWQTLRVEALVANKARCYVCGKSDVSNDAHHIRYRPRWQDTKVKDLVILCRKHHELVHHIMEMFPYESAQAVAEMIKRDFAMFWGTVHKMRKYGFKLRTWEQMRNFNEFKKAASRIPLLTNPPNRS